MFFGSEPSRKNTDKWLCIFIRKYWGLCFNHTTSIFERVIVVVGYKKTKHLWINVHQKISAFYICSMMFTITLVNSVVWNQSVPIGTDAPKTDIYPGHTLTKSYKFYMTSSLISMIVVLHHFLNTHFSKQCYYYKLLRISLSPTWLVSPISYFSGYTYAIFWTTKHRPDSVDRLLWRRRQRQWLQLGDHTRSWEYLGQGGRYPS